MYIRKAASPSPYDSLWEALGLGEKVLKKPFHIAAVGSGGKTTLLYTLAREARKRGLSVLLLPTTHMQLPEKDGVLTGRAEDVMKKLTRDGFAVAGVPVLPKKTSILKSEPSIAAPRVSTENARTASVPSPEIKKIGFPGWEIYEKAGAFADLVLVEADGSRRLPLKYPNETEPVIPKDIDLILAVTGLSALGKDPAKFCHRKELAVETLARAYSLLSGLATCKTPVDQNISSAAQSFSLFSPLDWQTITAWDMALLQSSGYLVPLRSRFSAPVIPVWNQADTEELQKTALSMLEFLGETEGLVTCTLP